MATAEDFIKKTYRYSGSAEFSRAELVFYASRRMIDDLEYASNWKVPYDLFESFRRYSRAGIEAAIPRMLARGQLIESRRGYLQRPNPGPSRECCYRVFSDVCLMDGPTYKEIGADSWPYSEYHTDQVVRATHELEKRGLIQGCFGYYNKNGGGASHWYPTGKSFPVSWLSIEKDGILGYGRSEAA